MRANAGSPAFAALAPNSPYGHLMADALREAASGSGGSVAKVEFFDPRAGDVSPAIQRLLPGGGAEGSAEPPPVSAAGRLLRCAAAAGRRRQLKQIAAQVKAAGGSAKPVQLLGSGLWDTPDIGSDPALVGGWFASSPPEARQDFERRFNATYGHNPPRLASLGYDAAALAAVLARGQAGEPFSQQAILNPSGFTGVDGLFRFHAQWSRAARPRGARSRAARDNRRQPGAAELSGSWLLSSFRREERQAPR